MCDVHRHLPVKRSRQEEEGRERGIDLSDVVRPSFEANRSHPPHDLKLREGARGVQALTGDARLEFLRNCA